MSSNDQNTFAQHVKHTDITADKALYYRFSRFLKERYGEKVYKLPVNIPVSCPNRDGKLGTGGCIFCGEEAAGFELLSESLGVSEQLAENAAYIGENYNSRKYIAYFQNYSNTYLPLERFKSYVLEACVQNVVAVYISTRPDCINDAWLDFLEQTAKGKGLDIVVELGLQTVNYRTLELLHRGHGLAEFIDAVLRIKRHGLQVCAHCIPDLPMDDLKDVAECARILSALGVDQVKCHSLYILKDTKLGSMFESGELLPVSLEEYIERLVVFLELLNPSIVIQRLIGRAPEERSLFCNWGMSWWKINDRVEEKMRIENRYQGRLFNYLNGAACMLDF
jgi:hypothetical protein